MTDDCDHDKDAASQGANSAHLPALMRRQIAAAFAYDKPKRLAVAVSGGGDSIALLRLLDEWARDEKVTLLAATVDHGLRPESAQEAAFVAETCAALGIKHTTLKWTSWQGKGNLQAAARAARYALLSQWARGHDIKTVALAHTADDQAETFFMRLTRASGIDGLTGMQRRRHADGIEWVRPLLMVEREELRAYLRDCKQVWIDDPSNDDETYDRVKARKALQALAPLGLDSHVVGRVMDHLGQVQSALDFATHDHALDCVSEDGGDLIIARRAFLDAAPEINRRLIARALRWIASADYAPRGMKLQAFLASISRGKDATLHGVHMSAHNDTLRLTREFAAVEAHRCAVGSVWDGRWSVAVDAGYEAENKELIVRALGDDGLAQLPERQAAWPPRASLRASPAVFDGTALFAAPLAGFGPAQAKLVGKDGAGTQGQFHTSLLSH